MAFEIYQFISHPKDVRMSCTIGIIELRLGIHPPTFLVQDGNGILVCDTELVWAISHDRTIFLMQSREMVGLIECQEFVHLPQIRELCQERSGVLCKRMEKGLIHNISKQCEHS